MSSYRSNYVQWKGGTGIGSSSYSPASSTSSLSSSTSAGGSGIGSSKFSTGSYKDTSHVSGSSGRLGLGSSRLGSTILSAAEKLSSASTSASGLSSTSKTSSSASAETSAPPKSNIGRSYGLSSVSSLTSKFSVSNDFKSSNLSSTKSSYLRSNTSALSGNSEPSPIKPKAREETSSNSLLSSKTSGEGIGSISKITEDCASGSTDRPGSSLSSYKPYSKTYTGAHDLPYGSSSGISSALRTTARFGLKSSHGHYNSSLPTASTLKAAAALAEETKKEMYRNEKKLRETTIPDPVSWMSRGTLTDSEEQKSSRGGSKKEESESIISKEEVPTFQPRVFSPRYEGVVKHKGIQTEEEPKLKILPSAIPRPTLSLNYYNSYGVGKFGTKNAAHEDDSVVTDSTSSNSNVKSKSRVGSVKEKDTSNSTKSSSSNLKKCNELGLNNNSDNATPGTLTSGGDQSSRSSQRTINNKIAVESDESRNNEHETSPSIVTTKTTTNPTNEDPRNHNEGKNSTGMSITVANKEFRKSALNVGGLNSQDAATEFTKRQEELKLQKSFSKLSIKCKDNQNSSGPADQASSIPKGTSASLANSSKRDASNRPPTDLNKSVNASSSVLSGSDTNDQVNSSSVATGAAQLTKTKSTKCINQLRKLSIASNASDSESCSSLSTSSALSVKGRNDLDSKKVKKSASNKSSSLLNSKLQGRRGSATSSSSSASSRCNSVERSVSLALSSIGNSKSQKLGGHDHSKPPSGQSFKLESNPQPVTNLPPKTKPKAKVTENKGGKSSESSSTPAQTSFQDRTLGNDTPWLRKCQSGELPWWLRSNPDVPAILRNDSIKSNASNASARKQLNSQKSTKKCKDEASSSELSNDELELEDDQINGELGERTAPDGVEVPLEVISPKSTLQTQKPDSVDSKSSGSRKGSTAGRKDSLFIGTIANIDDILGSVSPSLLPETPSPAPTPTPTPSNPEPHKTAMKNQPFGVQTTEMEDDETSSSSSSDADEAEDDLDAQKFHKLCESESEESSDEDDDNASTGTSSSFEEVDPCSVKIGGAAAASQVSQAAHTGNTVQTQQRRSLGAEMLISEEQQKQLDDATLQLYKDGEFGAYLDLECSISEQQEEFEGFLDNRKNSIVMRAQLPVRVHAIIEKLLTADGRELRRALFSLKQIFQEDKDLVHEFVENGGLNCLIKVGSDADQNYQNYILRAIGQVMLYVDGMYGVMRHNETLQWLYSLVASKFRLVQKTALKLLLVFVDYVETNCLLLVQAVATVDNNKGLEAWSNVMNLLREHDSNSGDTELLVYAITLVNKVLNAIPDIDTYYDQVDALEEQGMASVIESYMRKQCADLDLLKQFQIYELVLKHEDGEEDNIMMQLDENMRSKLLSRRGYNETESKDRRRSRRHSVSSTPPSTPNGTVVPPFPRHLSSTDVSPYSSLSSSSSIGTLSGLPNGHVKDKSNLELTPGLRRRRERADHQKNLMLEQLVTGGGHDSQIRDPDSPTSNPASPELIPLKHSSGSKKDLNCLELHNNMKNCGVNGAQNPSNGSSAARPWMLPIYTNSNGMSNSSTSIAKECENGDVGEPEKEMAQLRRENTVKDLTQKLASQNLLASPEENKSFIITGELSGVVSKAKEGLAKSKSRADMKPQPTENANGVGNGKPGQAEVKKSDNELHWDFLINNLSRPLEICDLDFTDLKSSDDEDILQPDTMFANGFVPPPPAPMMNGHPPPPPPGRGAPPPPTINGFGNFGTPLFGVSLKSANAANQSGPEEEKTPKKTKKTVKLFWKEVREDPITASKVEKVGCIWNEIQPTPVDTEQLEHLFESRAKDLISKKQSDANKAKEIVVLDPKRSNAINIGMTKLPPPRTIKTAILKMDSTIINREGIEKLLAMLPSEEERAKITEAQFANPETPLGSAEQFLLTLASISELTARLKLWAFKLDYENLEREVAEPLMDLKTGINVLEKNKTFRYILATLLSIGNFLNGVEAKGFQIEYLSKVPEVKDTVQKHSLLHHLCQTVTENFTDSTDLYSEIGPVTRASRVDFDEIATNLAKMESDCKTSWDHLRLIAKHDGPTNLKLKLSEFLADCAERIIVLGMIHRRVINRFHKFLLWMGVSAHQVLTTKPHTLFKVISEFALEYRTTRDRVIQQMQKKASHRERNKTRGKMITEQYIQKSKEDQEDDELQRVLKKTTKDSDEVVRGSLTWLRRQKPPVTPTTPTGTFSNGFGSRSSTLTSNGDDDEILESLVKTAQRTSDSRVPNRERKRNNGLRNSTDRKSLRRTLRHGLSEEEKKVLAAFMASGHTFCSS